MRALLLACVVVLATGAQPASVPDAPPDIQRFVKAALEDRLAANDIPDFNLARSQGRMPIRRDMRKARVNLTEEALPRLNGFSLYLMSAADLQAEADRSGQSIFFLIVDEPSIDGDAATVSLGLDVVLPRDSRNIKLCCCVSKGQFHKTTTWTFVKWLGGVCS